MHEMQTTEASRYLVALATRNAQAYAAIPNAKAVIVMGSAAEGVSDFYSDLDMGVYYDELPSEEALEAAYQHNRGQERRVFGDRSGGAFFESYQVDGVECQVAHTTIVAWERDIATVREQLDVTTPLQKALSGMLEARALYGEPLVQQWQATIAHYPDALAQAMVEHYLSIFPVWGIQERLTTRDAAWWLSQMLVEAVEHILGTLAGLNRLYYSSFQFKRMRRFVQQMEIAPVDLATRLEDLFDAHPTAAIAPLEALVGELVALVDQHMSEVDTTSMRQVLGWRQQAWKLL